jgi:apolipoprotein N-acyltransferase
MPRPLLAVAGGVLYGAALPPLGLWPLGWIVVTPLCIACARRGPARGAALGGLFGMTAAVATSPWLPAMIGDYFEASAWAAFPLALLAWGIGGAIYHAGFGAWVGWATARGPVSPFAVGAVWWVLEWARANAPVPNPWALLGYTQLGWLPAAQLADVVGAYGVGALLVVAGAALAGAREPRLLGRAPRRSGIAVAAAVVLALVYGATRGTTSWPAADTVRVGVAQGAVPRAHRYAPEHLETSLDAHLALTRKAARQDATLVVWPELALDFYPERTPRLLGRLRDALRDLGVDVLAGGLGIHADPGAALAATPGGTGERPTNSVFLIDAEGLRARYDKVRLMAFSEARPVAFLPIGSDRLAPGAAPRPIVHGGVALGIAVCSEAMHPGFVRDTVRAGAQVLVAPTVDSWFGARGGARQQLEATAMRAIETRRFVLRPTATGVTAVIDPAGRIVAEAPVEEPAVLVVEVAPRDESTLYTRWGDAPVWLAAAFVALDAGRRTLRRQADSA